MTVRIERLFSSGTFELDGGSCEVDRIIASLRERLLMLPADTTVHTGHGATTSVGAEAPHVDDWIARGH
ncbi:hypothetical protein [Streptomyces sp. NPDC050564]|uniref:hypothetical protein n=1 Tax=Streptomyces sp. NPDC050564 TaxID=3365631 RepID=UPI0037A094A4